MDCSVLQCLALLFLSCYVAKSFTSDTAVSKDVKPENYPWMARLMVKDQFEKVVWMFWCGGSLITREHVLTVAHCVKDIAITDHTGRQWPVTIYSVRLGNQDNRSEQNNKQHTEFYPISIIVHEEYEVGSKQNDLAIIKLSSLVNVTRFVNFINLIPRRISKKSFTGEWTSVGAWQQPRSTEDDVLRLLPMKLKIRNTRVCQWTLMQLLVPDYLEVNKNLTCASVMAKDPCQAHSGSAMVYYPEDDESPFLIGVASFGLGCDTPNLPAFYTRVSTYLHWIDKHLKKDFDGRHDRSSSESSMTDQDSY